MSCMLPTPILGMDSELHDSQVGADTLDMISFGGGGGGGDGGKF